MTPTDSEQWNRSDERGVSPVIGVVLMVAVTVVLAAVIGTFVLDLGGRVGVTAPTASLDVSADAATDNVTVRHRGGDVLAVAETRLLVERANDTTTEFARYDAPAGAGRLEVGDVARVSMGTATDGVDWPAGGAVEYPAGDAFSGLAPGDRVTVTVIDTDSDRVVFETTVRA